MVYNEPVMLPLWAQYYSKNFGAAACYVVDHGSTDSCTAGLGVNVVRIPRSAMNNEKRARFLSNFCSSLLEWYDSVIYTDCDEFLVPDPVIYASLDDYCQRTQNLVTTAIGLDVQHLPDLEAPFSAEIPVLRQRRWVRFNFALCKPLLTRVPINWTQGFHSSDQPTAFDRLFLFHLHNFDLDITLQRLAKTRAMPWEDARVDNHQRWSDQRYRTMITDIANLPKIESTTFEPDDPHITRYTQCITKFVVENPGKRHLFYHNNGVNCDELLRVPGRFVDMI